MKTHLINQSINRLLERLITFLNVFNNYSIKEKGNKMH